MYYIILRYKNLGLLFFILSFTVKYVGPEEPCTIDYATVGAHICAPPETCLLCSDGVEGFCSGEASGMAAWEHLLLVYRDSKNIELCDEVTISELD